MSHFMQLIIKETEDDFHREAAMLVSRQVLQKPDSVIGLATGNTTKGIHKWMIHFHKELSIDYSMCKTCNLDEYIGVSPADPGSCCYRIKEELLNHLNTLPENTYIPDSLTPSLERELDIFKNKVNDFGGVDLQIIAIGQNGHIAFNEPGTPFDSTYSIVSIPQSTVAARAGIFGGEDKVPKQGITMGIADIMMARKILLVASGSGKADMVRQVLTGPVTEQIPASVLRLHPNVVFVMDKKAASEI